MGELEALRAEIERLRPLAALGEQLLALPPGSAVALDGFKDGRWIPLAQALAWYEWQILDETEDDFPDYETPAEAIAVLQAAPRLGDEPEPGVCSGCGCTDEWGCLDGCSWANDEHTICTRCVGEAVPRD